MNKEKTTVIEKALLPIQTRKVPQHPYMAPNDFSNTHCDAYMTDSCTYAGPVSKGKEIYPKRHQLPDYDPTQGKFNLCVTLAFHNSRNIITLNNKIDAAGGLAGHELLLLDPMQLTILAKMELPTGGSGDSGFGCSGYFYLDQNYQAVVPRADGKIGVYAVQNSNDTYQFVQVGEYDPNISDDVSIISALPDWSGRIWVITSEGWVACINPDDPLQPHSLKLISPTGETEFIANSFAVDETGGVFVASDHAIYRFDYDHTQKNKIATTWREHYNRGQRIKPGQKSQGTGTTPTILKVNDIAYVAITDNADPQMHILVYYCNKTANGSQLAGQVPVFPPYKGATENSLVGVGNAFIVENNYGYTAQYSQPLTTNTEPGLAKIVFNGIEWVPDWCNTNIRIPSLVTKVSIAEALIYTYSVEVFDNIAKWYFSAVNFYTGKEYLRKYAGEGTNFDNYYSAIAINPFTGDAYVSVWGGIIRISN